MTIMMF